MNQFEDSRAFARFAWLNVPTPAFRRDVAMEPRSLSELLARRDRERCELFERRPNVLNKERPS